MITDHTQQELNTPDRDDKGKFVKDNPFKWKPGESGNKNGRPKGAKTGSAALRRMARELVDPKTGLNASELICAKLLNAAMAGEPWAVKEYFNRSEGMPGVRVEMPEIENWQELAASHGLALEDVYREARKLISESAIDTSDEIADRKA